VISSSRSTSANPSSATRLVTPCRPTRRVSRDMSDRAPRCYSTCATRRHDERTAAPSRNLSMTYWRMSIVRHIDKIHGPAKVCRESHWRKNEYARQIGPSASTDLSDGLRKLRYRYERNRPPYRRLHSIRQSAGWLCRKQFSRQIEPI